MLVSRNDLRCTQGFVGEIDLSAIIKTISDISDANQSQHKNTVVSICGGSCTGKSTQIASRLNQEFGNRAQVISQDHFMLASLEKALHTNYGWDHPDSFNLPESARLMECMRHGSPYNMACYSFRTKAFETNQLLNPTAIVFFDGLYAGYSFLSKVADYVIYAEMPLYARIIRRLFRNLFERYSNYDPRLILKSYLETPLKAHTDFVVSQRHVADAIIRVNYDIKQGLEKFNVTPVIDVERKEIVFEFVVDEKSSMVISTDRSHYYFGLRYDSNYYLDFEIDESIYRNIRLLSLTDL